MATVAIQSVIKKYNEHTILHGIDFQVEDGEFIVLVGPSGCGKSTLLRSIAGLEPISSGILAIDGRDVSNVLPKDRDIAMVFQNYALYPHMTVRKNMGFSLRLARADAAEAAARIERAADILGLTPLLDRLPKQLSGGQRQRVAMGRALVRDPKVFLFDEPLSNLDAALRVQMRLEIKELHRRLGATIIYVTHDQVEAMTMADRIVVMKDGRVQQIGSPLELYDRPGSIFVAGFIGSPAMNFVRGTAVAGDGPAMTTANGDVLPIPATQVPPGTELVLGIRPEDVNQGGPLQGTVLAVEPMGAETQVYVKLGKDKISLLTRDRLTAQPGDEIRLGYDTAKCHLFDAGTELRLPD